jgi:NitT/TauT family transport system ATP-binding protein
MESIAEVSAQSCQPGQPETGRTTTAPLLAVQRVDKRYPNGTVALEDVRLTIAPGEFEDVRGH